MMQNHIESLVLHHWMTQHVNRTIKGQQANILNPDEFKRLLKVVAANKYAKRDSLLVLFSFGLGLRAIEIAAIKLFQVIDEHNNIIETVKLQRTKGQKARDIYITDVRIKKAIVDYVMERKQYCEKKRNIFSLNQPLFLSQKGSHFTNKTMQSLFDRIYKSAGLLASSHSGRRTFATNLIEQGMDIRAVQVLMGHSNINETAKYVQNNPERLKRITANALY